MAIALWVEPEVGGAAPEGTATFTVRVSNQGDIVDRIVLDVLGPAAEWAVVEPAELSLFPRTDGGATVSLTPPAGTPSGPVAFGVRASGTASGLVEVGEATLDVGSSHVIEAELRPRTATGTRRATSVVVLHNAGNAAASVELVPSDPDDAIVFDAPQRLEVAPGTTAELPLRMRLPARPKQGATLPYTVVVSGPATGQSLDGQVRQPPRKRWPVMVALVVLALLAAAFLAFRPTDSVAVLGGGAEPDATTTTSPAGQPGETTTAVPVAGPTTVPGATTAPQAVTSVAGATTTAATVPVGPTTSGGTGGSFVVPTTGTTSRPPTLACPAKGDAGTTAQRVICAWELQRLGEVSDSVGATTATSLSGVPRVGAGATGQKVSGVVTDATGATVSFDRCGNARGVTSVRVPSAGADAGRVASFERCPAFAISG